MFVVSLQCCRFGGKFCAIAFSALSTAPGTSCSAWLDARRFVGCAAQQGTAVLCTGDLRRRARHAVPSSTQDDGTLFSRQGVWPASGKAGVLGARKRLGVHDSHGLSGTRLPVCLPGMQAGMKAHLARAGPRAVGCPASLPTIVRLPVSRHSSPSIMRCVLWKSLTRARARACVCVCVCVCARPHCWLRGLAPGRLPDPPHYHLHCSIVSTGTGLRVRSYRLGCLPHACQPSCQPGRD